MRIFSKKEANYYHLNKYYILNIRTIVKFNLSINFNRHSQKFMIRIGVKMILLLSFIFLHILRSDCQELIAHRGYSAQYPENTLVAIDASMKLGIKIIEVDIRSTKDGILVLHHNETIDKTSTHSGMLRDYYFSELGNINFNYQKKFGDKFSFIGIPTLEEAYDLVGNNYQLLLDIKENISINKIALITDKFGIYSPNLNFLVDNTVELNNIKKVFDDSKIYYLIKHTEISDSSLTFLKHAGVRGLALDNRYPSLKFRNTLKNFGFEVIVWNMHGLKNINSVMAEIEPNYVIVDELNHSTIESAIGKLVLSDNRILFINPKNEKIEVISFCRIDGVEYLIEMDKNGAWNLPENLSHGIHIFKVVTNENTYNLKFVND